MEEPQCSNDHHISILRYAYIHCMVDCCVGRLKLIQINLSHVINSNGSLSLFVISPQIVVDCCVYLVSCTLVNASVTFCSQLMCI